MEMRRRIIYGDAAHTSVFHTAVCAAIGRTVGRRHPDNMGLCFRVVGLSPF